MRHITLILHNVRSCHNVGAMLRTAEGLGVEAVYLTGYTPYPMSKPDDRMPFLAQKIDRQIHKTALGAEHMVRWHYDESVEPLLAHLRSESYEIVALEQAPTSEYLPQFVPTARTALVVGREVDGIEPEILETVDHIAEIPMFGKKESFNVAAAAAMALYHIRFAGSMEK